MKFNIIVAVDSNLGIGKNNTLPWRLPADLKLFKKLTTNAQAGKRNAVIMGRKTWDSLPPKVKPLPERLNIVLSRQDKLELPVGCRLARSLDQALELAEGDEAISQAFVIGGSELFSAALEHPQLERVYLTEIHKNFDCDVFFPDYANRLKLMSGSGSQLENDVDFVFKVFEPLQPSAV